MNRTIRKLRIVAVCCLMLAMQGCGSSPRVETTVTSTTVKDATPRERDLLKKLDLTGQELVDAQIKLDQERRKSAIELSIAQAKIRQEEADKQAAIDQAAALTNAKIIQDEKDGKIRRAILWALGIIAGLAVLAGGVVGWLTKSIATGGAIAAGGVLLLLVVLNAGDEWVTIAVRCGIGGLFALLLVGFAVFLWGKIQKEREVDRDTNANAIERMGEAIVERNPYRKALLVEGAKLLGYVGTPEFDKYETSTSTTAEEIMADNAIDKADEA